MEDKTTQFLNKKILQDKLFDSQEYDQQFKKEMKELWNLADNNPWATEEALKSYHKKYVEAIKKKDRESELYYIHRFYFLSIYVKWTNKLKSETWDKINKTLGEDWKGILY